MRRHAELLIAFFGPTTGIRHMRKWYTWYTSGFHGAGELRANLARVDRLDEMLALLGRLDPRNHSRWTRSGSAAPRTRAARRSACRAATSTHATTTLRLRRWKTPWDAALSGG